MKTTIPQLMEFIEKDINGYVYFKDSKMEFIYKKGRGWQYKHIYGPIFMDCTQEDILECDLDKDAFHEVLFESVMNTAAYYRMQIRAVQEMIGFEIYATAMKQHDEFADNLVGAIKKALQPKLEEVK